ERNSGRDWFTRGVSVVGGLTDRAAAGATAFGAPSGCLLHRTLGPGRDRYRPTLAQTSNVVRAPGCACDGLGTLPPTATSNGKQRIQLDAVWPHAVSTVDRASLP